ncbi:MAG TPA: single-stranded-DNA-specific exonuclease RecJ [Acidiferrobacteraceae bacterium]|nr:single-stranded-DNA-specific exonuclease RecJ [Acidiferrobacteraceae bacterium]
MSAGARRIAQRARGPVLPPGAAFLARALSARIGALEDLDCRWEQLIAPLRLQGMSTAVELLQDALTHQTPILVVADFDADGATSCALVVRALRALGGRVDYLVPDRFRYGYGLTPEIVRLAAGRGAQVLLTVDQGTTSVEGVALARELGLRVVVTDHHLPGAVLPQADALLNPNQPGDTSGAGTLAGVGVALYLMLALRAALRAAGRTVPAFSFLLDLVALGTVADVVPLDRNNRILVSAGIRRIQQGRACPGVRALLAVAGRNPESVTASDLAFAVGPRLNAAGRLADMGIGIACLLADDDGQAHACAMQLDALNRERRAIEATMQAEADALLAQLTVPGDTTLPFGLCLFHEGWHQGVIGILAGRLKERFSRPVIAFARGDAGQIKGSARSIPGFHVRDALQEISAQYPALVQRFGGHAMAAGLTLAESDLPAFAAAFDAEVRRHLGMDDLEQVLWTDGALQPDEFTLESAESVRQAGPWGQAFPEPQFDNEFQVLEQKVVGAQHLRLKLMPLGGQCPVEAIAFRSLEAAARIRAVYRLEVHTYRGRRSLQLVVEHHEPVLRDASDPV